MSRNSRALASGASDVVGDGLDSRIRGAGESLSAISSGMASGIDASKNAVGSGEQLRLCIDVARSGKRLDAVLGDLFPSMGVRGRRRLVERGAVLVNGRHAKPGQAVRKGDIVEAVGSQSNRLTQTGRPDGVPQVRLLGVQGDYCFFAKPALLHTVRVAGSSESSLEDQIPRLMAEASGSLVAEGACQPVCPSVRLLQRLDFETSGIVAGALSPEAEAAFRALERQGRVSKRYVCLVEGDLQNETVVASRLVSDGHGKERVMDEDDPDPARQTLLCPLSRLSSADISGGVQGVASITLAGVAISRGARHQIRVHAASLGHPLVGDSLYGAMGCFVPKAGQAVPRFLLHHGRLAFDSVCMECQPAWALPAESMESVHRWFAGEHAGR